jgi:putative NADPH-quinone reductase
MGRSIAIIQGHPDPRGGHLGHALADAYAQGAAEAGHEVRRINVATLEFPILRTKEDYEKGAPPEIIRQCQESVTWADHMLIVFPLWGGGMPALLKAFFEQLLRPGFAYRAGAGGRMEKLLAGKSVRIVVTMGMPAFLYRWYFRAHGLKALTRGMLALCGVGPIHETLIGMVEAASDTKIDKLLERMRALGRAAH